MNNLFSLLNFLLYILSIWVAYVSCYVKKDCIVGPWGQWSSCNEKCSIGKMVRTRNITQEPNWVFAKICPPLSDAQDCGVENNGCWFTCDKLTGDCQCPSGAKLDDNKKNCLDVNECEFNNGLGPCSQICTNIRSSYTCSCHKGFYLSNDKHDCIYDTSQDLCSVGFEHTIIKGKCVCVNGFSGLRCDRNDLLCRGSNLCADRTDTCLTFVHAPTCIKSEYKFPVLLRVPYDMYFTENYRYKIEIYIEKLLSIESTEIVSLHNLNTMISKSKSIADQKIVVEGVHPIIKIKSMYVFLQFVALKKISGKNYKPLKAKDVCRKLRSANVQCLDSSDCEIIKSAGYECPTVLYQGLSLGKQRLSGNKKHSYFWLFLSLPVLGVVAFFVYRKFKKSKENFTQIRYHDGNVAMIGDDDNDPNLPYLHSSLHPPTGESTQTSLNKEESENFLYGQDEPNDEPMYESIDNLCKSNTEEKSKVVVDLDNVELRYSEPPVKLQAKDI